MIYQVYYDEETKDKLEWEPYFNENLTEFFENSVILDLMSRGNHRGYFGVFGPHVREKVNFKEEGLPFNPENLYKVIHQHNCDAYGFCKRRKQDNLVLQAERYHPGFTDMITKILDSLGLKLPKKLSKIVLFNLLVAKDHFWEAYTKDLLIPAMEMLKEMPEAYEDSGYTRLKSVRSMTPEKTERFMKAFGKPWYPYHPFICERLPSIYLELHPEYSFKQIF